MLSSAPARRFWTWTAALVAVQFAVVFGLSVVEASHNHHHEVVAEWHGPEGGHDHGDGPLHAHSCGLCSTGSAQSALPALQDLSAPLASSAEILLLVSEHGPPLVEGRRWLQPRAPPVA